MVRDGAGMEGRYKGRFTSDHAFGECSYDVTVTATQKISNGAFGYSSAAGGAGHAASVAHREKVAKYKDQVAGWSVGRNRFRRFEPLAFESSGFARGNVRAIVRDWELVAASRLKPRLDLPPGLSTRREISAAIHYWNAVAVIVRVGDGLLVEKPLPVARPEASS